MPELKPLPCPASMNNEELLKLKHRFDDVCQSSTTPELFELCRAGSHLVDTIRSLPRALTWGEEPPKVLGWYWWRGAKYQEHICIYVRDGLIVEYPRKVLRPVQDIGGQWAGPIVAPGEAS